MDGILLLQASAQPVSRTVIRGRNVYVFLVPEGMDGKFLFEDGAEVTGEKPLFTVRKGGREADILLLSRREAEKLFILKDGSLVLTDAALLEDDRGALKLETTRAENTLTCFPPDRLAGKARRLPDKGPFGVYRADTEERILPVACEAAAPYRWTLRVPDNCLDGLKDARLRIDYRGDIGTLFLNDVMISDHFCNGDTWEIGLRDHREGLPGRPVLKISPIREGARVNVESAMAARNEEIKALTADLSQVKIQPVYEIEL